MIPTLAPSQSPTFCGKGGKSGSGKGGKSGAFDDDWTYTSGKGGKSGVNDCFDGPRLTSGKGGKSGAFDDDYYYDDDRRRLRKSSDSSVNKVPAGDRILSEPDAMKVRRRKIYGGD